MLILSEVGHVTDTGVGSIWTLWPREETRNPLCSDGNAALHLHVSTLSFLSKLLQLPPFKRCQEFTHHPVKLFEIWIPDPLLLHSDDYLTSCADFFFHFTPPSKTSRLNIRGHVYSGLQWNFLFIVRHLCSFPSLKFSQAVKRYINDSTEPVIKASLTTAFLPSRMLLYSIILWFKWILRVWASKC